MVREATQRRCKCHGLSGVCQFRTCWDQLLDFNVVITRLKLAYLTSVGKVEVKNTGSFEKPDLYLTYVTPIQSRSGKTAENPSLGTSGSIGEAIRNLSWLLTDLATYANDKQPATFEKVKPGDLIYLYDSPEYCEPQPQIQHPGTRDRACKPLNNVTLSRETSKKSIRGTHMADNNYVKPEGIISAQGSCEMICCNRGYRSELVLDMVTCNCRFKFCCKVECDRCLQQRVQHFCL